MAYNEQLAQRVRESLSHIDNVKEKKMFRGMTFMVNDKMCISIGDDQIMCRINPDIHNKLLETKNCKTMKMKGRDYKGYILVNENELKSKKELDYWIGLALEFNKHAKSSKKKK
jgi:TfoX/Sxy family transcriptional regulator of competence genes